MASRRVRLALAVPAVILPALYACGGDDADGAPPGGSDAGANVDASRDGNTSEQDAASGEDAGGKVDAGGAFAFFSSYLAGFGGARVVAAPGGGFIAAFGHSAPITVGAETIPVSGRYDIVVVKLDAKGAPVWTRPIAGGDDDDVQGLAVDDQGNVYVSGQSFSSTLDFGNGKTASKPGTSAIGFVAKLDAAGVAQWAQRVRSAGGVRSTSIAARGGAVIYAGTYTSFGDVIYYPTTGGEVAGPSFMNATTSRGFAMALDASTGNASWLSLFGAGEDVDVATVSVDAAGSAVLAGTWGGGGDMKDKTGTTIAAGGAGGFVLKLTAAGDTSWTRVLPAPAGAAVSSGGAIIAAGTFAATADLGKGPRTSQGVSDGWGASLDPATGATIWDRTIGGTSEDRVTAVATDSSGSVSVTLHTKGGAGMVDGITLPAAPGAYVARLEPSGTARWFRPFAASDPSLVFVEGVAISAEGVAAIGTFKGSVDFGQGAVVSQSTSGRSDTYVVGFGP